MAEIIRPLYIVVQIDLNIQWSLVGANNNNIGPVICFSIINRNDVDK